MKSSFLHTLAVLLIGLFWVSQLQAQATLSVQGTIVQNSFTGGAAAIDNGQYDITFKLYTTDAGGTAVWTETQTISIVGGVYSALLGAVNPLNVPFDQLYFLGLTLPGGPEHTPRAQLTAAPYAVVGAGQQVPLHGKCGHRNDRPEDDARRERLHFDGDGHHERGGVHGFGRRSRHFFGFGGRAGGHFAVSGDVSEA
jgi:hypothetical protein